MVVGSFVVLIAVIVYIVHSQNSKAKELGFASVEEYTAAAKQKITDPREWETFKAKQVLEAKKQAKAEKPQAIEPIATQEAPSQQAAPATSQSEPEKINPKLDPSKNIKLILDTLNAQNRPWQSNWHTICTNSNFCSVQIGDFNIQAVGGTVNIIERVGQFETADYMQLCSTILSALGNISQSQADEFTINAFRQSSQLGSKKFNISSVDLTIRVKGNSRLACDFFHATNAAMLSPDASDEAKGQPEEAVIPDDGQDVPMHDLDWSDLDKKK